MNEETQTTDGKARLVLPKEFANAVVVVERISDTELRVRKTRVVAEDELAFPEEAPVPLSDRDRDLFLSLIANPPEPTPALKKAVFRRKARRG